MMDLSHAPVADEADFNREEHAGVIAPNRELKEPGADFWRDARDVPVERVKGAVANV